MNQSRNPNASRFLFFLFIVQASLAAPLFFPSLSEVGPYDEALYIHNGRMLAEGQPPLYAYNPLGAFLYAGLSHLFQDSPFWLVLAAGLGRFILFCLLWVSCWLVARSMLQLENPWFMMGLLFISPAPLILIRNSSYALFSGFSALAFWQAVMFFRQKKLFHLVGASFLVGMAALSRNDGLFLIIILILAGLMIHGSRHFPKSNFKRVIFILMASLLPFVMVVGGYLSFYARATGNYALGTKVRAYSAFRAAQGKVYDLPPGYAGEKAAEEGLIAGDKGFGTGGENKNSIFKAIRRNPRLFLKRVGALAVRAPLTMISAYGKGLGILLFLLIFLGILELIKRKEFLPLALCLIWPLHLLVYFAFYFRRETLLLHCYIAFFLGAMGIRPFVACLEEKRAHLGLQIFLASLAFLGVVFWKMLGRYELLFGASALMSGLFLIREALRRFHLAGQSRDVAFALILFLGLLMSAPYPIPKRRDLGAEAGEQAVLFLEKHFQKETSVAGYFPAPLWEAGMGYVSAIRTMRELETPDELLRWLATRKCGTIYVDKYLKQYEPNGYALIRVQIGKSFKVVFSSDDGSVQILTKAITSP